MHRTEFCGIIRGNENKLGFIEGTSPPRPPLKPFLKEGFKNPKNFENFAVGKFAPSEARMFAKKFFGISKTLKMFI